MKVRIGPIAATYNGTIEIAEADETARRAVMRAKARDAKGRGGAEATITSTMAEVSEGTRVTVETDLRITGPAAQFGRGVMEEVSAKMMDRFADCLATQMGGGEPAAEAPQPRARSRAAAETPRRTRGTDRGRAARRRARAPPERDGGSPAGRGDGPAGSGAPDRGGARPRRAQRRRGDQARRAVARRDRTGRGRGGRRPAEEETMSEPAAAEALPFRRSNLREQIKDVILQRIVEGSYEPGSRLVETRIAQELGVSQAPVREALRDLEQLGCVVHEPYRGCSVRAFSAAELMDAFPVRAALEALAARLAAERITDAGLDELDDLHRAHARGRAQGRRARAVAGQRIVPRHDRARLGQSDAGAPVEHARALLAHLPDGVAPGHRPDRALRAPPARSSRPCAGAIRRRPPRRCTTI